MKQSTARPKQSQHAPPRKQLRAIQTSRHFHMAHHRHSGHVLPRSNTSYPLLIMIMLCVGVLLTSWTHVVTADTVTYPGPEQDSYVVHASVPGPAPTQAATIDSPHNSTHFTATPITVNGTCPANTYVSIYRNNFYSGSAICDGSGSYQLSVDLFSGTNQLVARDFNYTDVAGPDSSPVTVYYDPPVVVPPVTTLPPGSTETTPDNSSQTETSKSTSNPVASKGFSSNSSASSASSQMVAQPLTLSSNFTFRGYFVGQQSIWQLDIEGGSSPYALAIDWGDGSSGIVSRGTNGLTRITHTYARAGGFHGTYIVKFSATDAAGNQTFLQQLVIVNNRQPSTVGRTSQAGGNNLLSGLANGSLYYRLVHYIWPGYGLVLLMLLSFWLGERREFHYLKPRLKRARHA